MRFVALVAALTGTAAAATVLITKSSQIKKGVVTGTHVKDGSLGAADLSAAARSALKGAGSGRSRRTGRGGRAGRCKGRHRSDRVQGRHGRRRHQRRER